MDAGTTVVKQEAGATLAGYARQRPKRSGKVVWVTLIVIAAIAAAAATGAYLYWRSMQGTPQYSLALLVDAATRNDQAAIDRLVDTGGLIESFVPQVTDKAIEMYGRGLPPQTLERAAKVAEPLMPAVKARARMELPRLIRSKTEAFSDLPFTALVVGADRYLDIEQRGGVAVIRSRDPAQDIELQMRARDGVWQVISVRDDQLATQIARSIGQELIAIAKSGGDPARQRALGLRDVSELLRQAEAVFGFE